MIEITFVTTNDEKWRVAKRALKDFPVELRRAELETPEIQAASVEDVAGYSAQYAANKLEKSVIVTDGGYYVCALNGFPGPFQKYLNQWLTPGDFINLMKPYEDRSAKLITCLAFCEPGLEPTCFTSMVNAKVAHQPQGTGSILDQVLILEGFERTQGSYPIEILREHWANMLTHYQQFGEYIQKRQKL